MRVDGERAVVDRIVDDQSAVLIVGDDQREVVVPAGSLPDGAGAGTWLSVTIAGDELADARIDHEATEQARGRIASKMAQLRQRSRRR